MSSISLFQPVIISKGKRCAIISIGEYLKIAEDVCCILKKHSIKPTLIDARYAKPLDKDFYLKIFQKHSHVITIESNSLIGGFGSAVLELASKLKEKSKIMTLGYPDNFITHGTVKKLLEHLSLTPESIAKSIVSFIDS